MDYIYDIVLNFQERYYDFYEWCPNDKIVNIKKITIYKILNNDYLNIKNNSVIIDKTSLPKQNKIFLLTNGLEVMGLLLNNYGKVIKISSLLFDESDDILEDKDDIKSIGIKYKVLKKKNINLISRNNIEKKTYTNKYLKKLDLQKDEYLIKYLYYDIYSIEENDINKAYNKLLTLAKQDLKLLYESIQKINLELKK